MSHLNYEFFDEFKALDNLCRDIYGQSIDNKLGVTLYLEDMERNAYQGALKVPGWAADYNQLKNARNIRNELAHSRNSFSYTICSQEDISFIRYFRSRILNQADPIALLGKRTIQSHPYSNVQPKQQPSPSHIYTTQKKPPIGCLFAVTAFLIVVACTITFFI